MMPSLCRAFCDGHAFAGVQFADECFCGNQLGYASKPDSECNMHCSGDSEKSCGGFFRNSIYALGGTDDNPIGTLDELDAIPHIGPIAFDKLVDYWQLISTPAPWRQSLPQGQFDVPVYIRILAEGQRDPQNPVDVLERVSCRVHGNNPGNVFISCQRDSTGFEASAAVALNGSFAIEDPDGADSDRYPRTGRSRC